MNRASSSVDLRRMRVAVEVARARAITTAAETLGLTQSAVSRTVAELETALGVRLFERLPRGIQLTPAGQRFVDRARRVLADVDDLVTEVHSSPEHISGHLRLGIGAVGTHAMNVCAGFAARYPEVAIATVHASDQDLCPRALNGELDLLIGSSSYLQRWRELSVTRLRRLNFACMVRKSHPLAKLTAPAEIDVLRYPLLMPESVEATYSDIAQCYARHGLPSVRPQYVTNNPALIDLLLQSTDAFFPILHPNPDFGGLGKRFHLIHDAVTLPEHYISFARPTHRPRTEVVAIFEQCLLDALQAG